MKRRRILTYGDERIILSLSFINLPDMKVVYSSEVFEMVRQWKDKRLVYDTVKMLLQRILDIIELSLVKLMILQFTVWADHWF